ncbi:hypothetical protein ACIBF1_22840 [Spirillospora sp. NPDC050679]
MITFVGRGAGVAGATLTIAASLLSAAAPASAQPTPPAAALDATSSHRTYRNYLAPSVRQRAAGEDQCAKPVSQRTGNWFCAPPRDQQVRQNRERNPQLSAQSGHCETIGCWNVFSTTESNFSANGWFGYNSKTLGTVNFYYDVTLNGGQSVSKPVGFSASIALSSLMFEGDRLYYSPAQPQGKPVRGTNVYNFTNKGAAAPGPTVFWTPNGYKAYENTVQLGSVVHQATWTVSGYPGHWYLFGKSVRFHLTSSSYRFGEADDLGSTPTEAGWNPV